MGKPEELNKEKYETEIAMGNSLLQFGEELVSSEFEGNVSMKIIKDTEWEGKDQFNYLVISVNGKIDTVYCLSHKPQKIREW